MINKALRMAVLAAVLCAAPAGAKVLANKPGQYTPKDTCTANPGARDFVKRLRTAQQDRSAEAIRALTGPEFTGGFGGEVSIDDVLDDFSSDPYQWTELGRTLSLGCKLEGDKLTLPWFFTLDFGNADMTDKLLATGPAVPVYAGQSSGSKVLGKLNWQLVQLVGPKSPELTMLKVRLLGGKLTGYVKANELRSQFDQRLVAVKIGGEWRINALVEGD